MTELKSQISSSNPNPKEKTGDAPTHPDSLQGAGHHGATDDVNPTSGGSKGS